MASHTIKGKACGRLLRNAIAVAGLSILAACGKSPESVIESFYFALAKGEITEAQTYISSRVAGMLGSQKLRLALEGASQKITKCGGVKSVAAKLEGQGEIRTGSSTITFSGNCRAETERVKLVKEDGKWKIDSEK